MGSDTVLNRKPLERDFQSSGSINDFLSSGGVLTLSPNTDGVKRVGVRPRDFPRCLARRRTGRKARSALLVGYSEGGLSSIRVDQLHLGLS